MQLLPFQLAFLELAVLDMIGRAMLLMLGSQRCLQAQLRGFTVGQRVGHLHAS